VVCGGAPLNTCSADHIENDDDDSRCGLPSRRDGSSPAGENAAFQLKEESHLKQVHARR